MPNADRDGLRLRDVHGPLTALRGRFAVAVVARLLGSAFALAVPFALGKLALAVTNGGTSTAMFTTWSGVLFGAITLLLAAEFASSATLAAARYRLIAQMRARWFERLLRARTGAFDGARIQDWVTLLGGDIGRIAGFVVSVPTAITFSAVVGLGSIVLMARLSLVLTAGVVLVGPILFFASRFFARRVEEKAARYWDAEVEALRHAHESLAALSVVKTFAVEDERISRQSGHDENAMRSGTSQQLLKTVVGPATQLVGVLTIVAIVVVGTRDWVALEVAELTAFVGYALLLTTRFRSIAGLYSSAMAAYGGLERFRRATALPGEEYRGDVIDLEEPELVFEDVRFSYGDTPVFSEPISWRIRSGDSIVLVGANGEGKSTLIALLLRLREPAAGRITLDGHDVKTLDLRWYRRLFAVALQETVVIDGTVRDNVRFGRPDASEEAVAKAARAALLDEVVDSLPRGWETRVGEKGVRLSGGQRQRLALARAFLCDARFLVFDEATSMFDPSAKRRFVDRNRALFEEKTLIWVTHGDAARSIADQIIEVKDGNLRAPLRSVEEQPA